MDTKLIRSDTSIMMGKPVIAGTRIPVELILEKKLAAGETIEQLLEAHPRLTKQGVYAALSFAAQALRVDETSQLASRWKRLGGALLDSLIAMAISLPVMMVAGVFQQITQGEQMTIGQRVFFFFFGLAVFLLINGYLLAKHGQTVGKKLVSTRIVSHADESLLSFGAYLRPEICSHFGNYPDSHSRESVCLG